MVNPGPLIAALLALAHAAPTTAQLDSLPDSDNTLSAMFSDTMDNAVQVVQGLNADLRSGDDHPSEDVINSFVNGYNTQINELAGLLGPALDPYTLGISDSVASMAVGPLAQSVTEGVQSLLLALATPVDSVAGPALESLIPKLNSVSRAAKANHVDTTDLDRAIDELNNRIAGIARARASESAAKHKIEAGETHDGKL